MPRIVNVDEMLLWARRNGYPIPNNVLWLLCHYPEVKDSYHDPETHDKRTETHGVCLDVISRQAAIDEIKKCRNESDMPDMWYDGMSCALRCIYQLPPEQPERKKGKWIAVTEDGDVYKRICSCCGREAFFQNDDPDELYDGGRYELSDFCPHCGADMREDDHE